MALSFIEDEDNLFPHSKATDTGGGRERIGQATVIVSLDGSGDTDSIQEAINMLPKTGGMVFIKEGTYNISTEIFFNHRNVSLIGTGTGTIINQTDVTKEIIVIDFSEIILRDLKITNGDIGIDMHAANNCSISSIWITGTASYAINLVDDSNFNIISNNFITSCNDGIRDIANNVTAGNNIITNNTIENCTNSGIRLETFNGGTLQLDTISNNNINNCTKNIYLTTTAASPNGTLLEKTIISNNHSFGASGGGEFGIEIEDANVSKTILCGNISAGNNTNISDNGTNTHPNGASGTTNLALDDLNIIA